ncbi:GNAT family N-acetyltransferase [Furfurilactobacillus entadae]|uniref:GNAT family N-acetyltransferase n=1 Tax=Furfurilactobacillus entadae TaxID=2922307 RepID=UPI0035E9189A
MKFHRATLEEFDTVMAILSDGRNQLAESGIDQWQGEYPAPEHIRQDIDHGYAYLLSSDDEETIGTVTVMPAPDDSYANLQGNWLKETTAYLTIHRVAIHSDHAGKGYASTMFEGLIAHVEAEYPHIESLRIDTHQDNKPMQHLLSKMGFTKVGEIHGVYRVNETSYVYEQLVTRPQLSTTV